MEPSFLTNLKNSFNKKLLCIIIILMLIPLVLIICFRFTPKSIITSKLNDASNEIFKINSTLSNAISHQTINTDSVKNILTSGINSLDLMRDNINKFESNEDTQEIKTQFLKVLDSNIYLFEISLSIVNNTSSQNIKSKYKELLNAINRFSDDYKVLDKYSITYKLPDSFIIFFKNMQTYTNSIIKVNMEKDIENEQKRDFLISVNSCLDKLKTFKKDLKPTIDSINKDGRSLSVMVDNINIMKSELSALKKESQSFSIPPIGKNCYNSLSESIKLCSIYINEIENAVITDMDNGDSSNSNEIYDSAYSKHKDFLSSLDRLYEHISLLNN